ncbi:hypothetical protein C7441_112176 [Pseudaminobacter salicylatoxidans]|uniref:DUF2213 domain-containing protein n=1 Tax=Pseudaminobacter salicylatoxidans TaxID=93369 RepID=A0A316BZU4_PSESE|nr:DUF2213 domain-containing protein [Pseudaminobacter salicylatoxidans]PWJ80634.1 hypothetical protein C7441_112176 [Pseudaminobacter salicylatoxidans]
MQFIDTVTVAGTRRRDDGYLVADARVARIGIQTYAGWEVGKPNLPLVRVYRPEGEVFSRDTLASFAHRPVTNDHPDEVVTADNWKELAVGQTADEIARDGTFIRVPLMVADAAAIKDIEGGKRELSAGYTCDLAFEPGTTPEGEAYDAVQKNIRANHVAIVQRGRAGSEVRIGDASKWGPAPITPTMDKETVTMSDALRTVVVDGLSVQTTDQGAQAIQKLLKDLESSAAKLADADKAHQTKLADVEKAHADAVKAKDAELASKDEEIGTLKADKKKLEDAAPKPADIDKMVAARAELVTTVKAIDAKIETDGKTDADLRRAAVKAKLGDEMVKDASDAEVAGMFKAVAKDVKPVDPLRTVVAGGLQQTSDADKGAAEAYVAMVKDMMSAHQPAKAN